MTEPQLDVDDIQGHALRGFSTPALTLLGLQVDDPAAVRRWLAALSHRVDTLARVHRYRMTRSLRAVRTPHALLNVALSAHALTRLGTDLSDVDDGLFLNPMGFNAASLGDAVDAAQQPTENMIGSSWADTPDISSFSAARPLIR